MSWYHFTTDSLEGWIQIEKLVLLARRFRVICLILVSRIPVWHLHVEICLLWCIYRFIICWVRQHFRQCFSPFAVFLLRVRFVSRPLPPVGLPYVSRFVSIWSSGSPLSIGGSSVAICQLVWLASVH